MKGGGAGWYFAYALDVLNLRNWERAGKYLHIYLYKASKRLGIFL